MAAQYTHGSLYYKNTIDTFLVDSRHIFELKITAMKVSWSHHCGISLNTFKINTT